MTTPTRPRTNGRGKPWTSAGRRNLAARGTGRGNGGVTPPGHYQRRRFCLTNHAHDQRWRTDWLKLVTFALGERRITTTEAAVAMTLADYSNDHGKHVFPSHADIGRRCGRSASTVGRALKTLRRLGLLEWEHRFKKPDGNNPLPSATSNRYEFFLPAELLQELGLRQKHRRRSAQPPAAGPSKRALSDDERHAQTAAAGVARLAPTYEAGLQQLADEFGDKNHDLLVVAIAAFEQTWSRARGDAPDRGTLTAKHVPSALSRQGAIEIGAQQAKRAADYHAGAAQLDQTLQGVPVELILLAKEEYDLVWRRLHPPRRRRRR